MIKVIDGYEICVNGIGKNGVQWCQVHRKADERFNADGDLWHGFKFLSFTNKHKQNSCTIEVEYYSNGVPHYFMTWKKIKGETIESEFELLKYGKEYFESEVESNDF